MTQRNKLSSRLLSLFLAMLMIVSMIPATVFAAPASDIPDEMLDNVYLDALAYTGYQVQAQKNDGTIYKTYGSRATAYGSDISYGLVKYGTETVTKSGTATGLAPDIAGFESSGLCCASYVSYVYYNYLPNIAGIDTSGVAKPSNPRSASSYNTAANAWVNAGTARRISFTQNSDGSNFQSSEEIPIGSLIVFKHKTIKSILLVIAMLCVLCFPVQVMAETQQGTNGDELQLMEAQKLEIQLGAEWAGVEFQLKTDAGLYPGTVVVGQDGVLRTEIGGSSTYILTCLNSAVEVPEPTQDSATTEKPDTENQSGTDEAEEGGATVAGIPVLHIVLFGGGMVVAVGALIAMHVVKKRRESDSAYDDDEDE